MSKEVPFVLYAEDNRHDVDLFRYAMEELELPYRLENVRDGREVMDFLRCDGKFVNRTKEIPLAIILDLKMPKVNGIEALKMLRSMPELARVPVMMLTSSQMQAEIDACYQNGANAYTFKPVDFDHFIEIVAGMNRFWAFLHQQG